MTEIDERTQEEEQRGPFAFARMPVSRRSMIRGGMLGAAGLAAAALIGCGDDDDDDDDAPAATATTAATQAAAGGDDDDDGGAEADYVTAARAAGATFAFNFPEPDETPRKGGTYNFGLRSGHGSFDLDTAGPAVGQSAGTLVGDQLFGYNVGPTMSKFAIDVNLDFGLVKSFDVTPDGMTYTLNLREAKFHNVDPVNGRMLDAQDVVFAIERFQVSRQAGLTGGISTAEVVDERTVRLNMSFPNADMVVAMGNREVPIYAREIFEAGIADTTPIGTGPAILDHSQTVPEQELTFVSNPDYWGGAPLLDAIKFKTLPDAATRTAALRTGQIHTGSPANRLDEIDNLIRDLPGMQVTNDPILMGLPIYAVNSNVAPFTDVRVRRGLKLAMDNEKYLAILRPGQYSASMPAFGWPFVFDSQPTSEQFGKWWANDKAEARKLLDAALGVGEELTYKHRNPIGFASSTEDQDVLIQEDLAEVGVKMDVLAPNREAFVAAYYSQQFSDPDLRESDSLYGWSTQAPTGNGYFWDGVHSQSSTARFDIRDPEVDRLADLARESTDPDEQREIRTQLFDYFQDQAYWMDKTTNTGGWTLSRPEVRFYRWNGPYIGIHQFWDWGMGYHKAWLGDDLGVLQGVDLRK